MEQLTNLTNLKAWLEDPSSTSADALLTRLIQQASRFILNYTQRASFYKTAISEMRNGYGGQTMPLMEWPATNLSSVIVGSRIVTSSQFKLEAWNGLPPGGPQLVAIEGGEFTPGNLNVAFSYTTGFYITGQSATVPASGPSTISVQAANGNWGRDDGVTLTNGTPLTLVTGTPGAMQYTAANGIYTFNAAQAGAGVLISYSYIPSDIEQACIEIAAERYRYLKRIGQTNVSAAGQITTGYSLKALQDYVRETLDNYKRSFIC